MMRRSLHVHALKPVAVYHPADLGAVFGAASPRTVVLLGCPCGEGTAHLDAISLRGRWTLEQIQQKPPVIEFGGGQFTVVSDVPETR